MLDLLGFLLRSSGLRLNIVPGQGCEVSVPPERRDLGIGQGYGPGHGTSLRPAKVEDWLSATPAARQLSLAPRRWRH